MSLTKFFIKFSVFSVLVIFSSGCGATFTFGDASEKPPVVYVPMPQQNQQYGNDYYIPSDMYQ